MMALQKVAQSRGNWVRESEHIVLRFVSLVFSVGSAYAVRWFFEPLDAGDPIHYVLWWIVAIGFGLLGFYLSRSLTHRMMQKEPVWAYAPLFLLVEFFEILCNYAKAVSVVSAGSVSWVIHAPVGQQGAMTVLTYVGWSIIPLVSPMMAVADMDMTRRRNGEIAAQQRPAFQGPQARPQQSSQWNGNPAQKPPLPRPGSNGAPQQPPMRSQQQNGTSQQPSYQGQSAGSANGANPPPGVSRN
jgi:hypothetical protein